MIAYSYRPIQSPALMPVIRNLSRLDPYHIELVEYHPSRMHLNYAQEETSESGTAMQEKRRITFRGMSKVDLDDNVQSEELLVELTKGQTFLCASSYVYAPKPVYLVNLAYDQFC